VGHDHASLQTALGGVPSVWACYRFTTKLRLHSDKLADCLDRVTASLQDALPGIGQDVAIDASDLPAFANGQRYVSKGGPERERFSDPDASWGHRSAVSTRKGGGFYGYKLQLAVCSQTGLPLAWRVETAKRHESNFVAPLLDALHVRGFRPETCAMDRGYDYGTVADTCEQRGVHPVIPIRAAHERMGRPTGDPGSRHNPHISRYSERACTLYRGRGAVEREFGRLKNDYGLLPLRTRGLQRVQLHADLVMLARLSQTLSRARGVPLVA
jgi:hypothetical protein